MGPLESLLTQVRFDSLDINPLVLKGIQEAGFEFCTPIQAKTLPLALKGKDVAGQAQTGTGKTAAFLINLFHQLLEKPGKEGKRSDWVAPRGLIIAPTRELARQIEKDASVLGQFCGFKSVTVYGGVDYERQKTQIKKGADILIVTPGRFIDYYKQKFFSLKSVEVLVIDEADRMFDMGFIQDLRFILRNTSPYFKRQSMLFSATLNFRVMELCYEHMNNPEKIAIEPEKVTVDLVEQVLYHVGSDEKMSLLLGLLKKAQGSKVIIFCNTKDIVDQVEAFLKYNHLNADQISGDLHQRKRIRVLEQFSAGELDILIATDVASRGLHIDDITHVVNFDLPQDPEDYIHRIGRTARAGAKGTALSFCCEDYALHLERIEEMLKFKIPVDWPEDDMFAEIREGQPKLKKDPRKIYPKKDSGNRRRSGGDSRPRNRKPVRKKNATPGARRGS